MADFEHPVTASTLGKRQICASANPSIPDWEGSFLDGLMAGGIADFMCRMPRD
jgi:hypothetical protein